MIPEADKLLKNAMLNDRKLLVSDFDIKTVHIKHSDGSEFIINNVHIKTYTIMGNDIKMHVFIVYAEHFHPMIFFEDDLLSAVVKPRKGRSYKMKLMPTLLS